VPWEELEEKFDMSRSGTGGTGGKSRLPVMIEHVTSYAL
jgi:hypothetical protein